MTQLNAEMVKIIQSPEFKKRTQGIGAESVGDTPEEMVAQIRLWLAPLTIPTTGIAAVRSGFRRWQGV